MNKVLLISVVVVLALSVGLVGCEEEVPTKIKIGSVRSLTGGLDWLGNITFTPIMKMWERDVNAAGGIYVEEYGKKLPVEITIQDDGSNITAMETLLTAMVSSGDYHFVLPPISAEFLQAAAAICSEHEYVLMGAESGCPAIETTLDIYPYLFRMLNFSTWNQMEELFEILRDWQTNQGAPDPMNVYIIYGNYLDGFEYRDAFLAEAANYPDHFDIVKQVRVEQGETNLTGLLEEGVSLNTTFLCSFTHYPTNLETIRDAADNGYNFDAMIVGPVGNWEFTLLPRDHPSYLGVGGDLMEGVMSFGAWNEYSSNETADFTAHLIDDNEDYWEDHLPGLEMTRYTMDWWGHAPYYAGLQCLQQAIERAGTLDNDDVRAELATAGYTTAAFSTVLGDAYFTDADGNQVGADTGGLLAKDCYLGQIGQWQKVEAPYWGGNATNPRAKPYGIAANATEWYIFEVIDIDDNQTAEGIYPKPPWP